MNTPWDDDVRLELESLLSRRADAELTPVEKKRFEEILLASEQARRLYVRFCGLEMSLAAQAGDAHVDVELGAEEKGKGLAPVFGFITKHRKALSVWGAAAAACVLFAGLWARRVPAFKDQAMDGLAEQANDGSDADSAAVLSATENCRWSGEAMVRGLQTGDALPVGQRLILDTGVAELAFDSGARLVMQGPSELVLHSAWEAHLHTGLVRANVPPEAIGFRVSSPDVDVVDLGTEFSLAAAGQAGSDVLVHEGQVQVKPKLVTAGPKAPRKTLLKEKEGLRFTKNSPTKAVPSTDANWKALDGRLKPLRSLLKQDAMLWTFDASESVSPSLRLLAEKAQACVPQQGTWPLGTGKNGQGLQFTEEEPRLPLMFDLGVPEHLTSRSNAGLPQCRSFLAWVRVEPTSSLADAGTWLAFNPNFKLPGLLALGWNGNPAKGVAGAATLRFGQRVIVGTTPINDGKWHQIAGIFVVRVAEKTGQLECQMRLHVDAKLEVTSARYRLKTSDFPPGVLGAGQMVLGSGPLQADPFLGQVDDLMTVERPLNAHELSLMLQLAGSGGI